MRRRVATLALPLLRAALGLLLLRAGVPKAADPLMFAQTVRAYDVLPILLIHPFAVAVPWVEILAGLCLLLGFWVRSAALAVLLLLLAFETALAINLGRGADFSCGCFALDGTGASLHEAFLRNVLLVASTLVLLLARRAPFSLDALLEKRPSLPG